MARLRGYFEWDDGDLTPGKNKDGGLHQNLYNEKGELKDHARFIPTDPQEPEEIVVTEYVYVQSEDRREDDELSEAIASLIVALGIELGRQAAPHVKQWWNDTGWPYIATQSSKVRSRLRRRSPRGTKDSLDSIQTPHEPASGTEISAPLPKMSAAEAKARLLGAAAACAFSDEQMRMVNESEIVGAYDVDEIRAELASLPQEELIGIVEQLVRNPAGLGEENLANLASLLGRRQIEIESNKKPKD